jgi:hypothetical protein
VAVRKLHGRLALQSVVNTFVDTFAHQAALGIFAVCLVLMFGAHEQVRALLRWSAFLSR